MTLPSSNCKIQLGVNTILLRKDTQVNVGSVIQSVLLTSGNQIPICQILFVESDNFIRILFD